MAAKQDFMIVRCLWLNQASRLPESLGFKSIPNGSRKQPQRLNEELFLAEGSNSDGELRKVG